MAELQRILSSTTMSGGETVGLSAPQEPMPMMKGGSGPPPMQHMMDSLIESVMNGTPPTPPSAMKMKMMMNKTNMPEQQPSVPIQQKQSINVPEQKEQCGQRKSPTEFIKRKKAQVKQEGWVSAPGGGASTNQSPTRHATPVRDLGSIEAQIVDAKKMLDAQRLKQVDKVIETVVEAHMTTCNYTAEKVAAGVKKYEAFKKSGKMPMMPGMGGNMPGMNGGKPNMPGMNSGKPNMPGMPGGDGKPDPSKMWGQFVQNMVPVITRVVNFSKKIPGFTELSQSDQITLIKQGSFEVICVRYMPLFDDEGMFIPSMEMKIPKNMVKHMPMGSFFGEQFKFSHTFNPLGLEDGEVGLLTALMISCGDRKNVEDRTAVLDNQCLLLQALYQYMKRLRPDDYEEMFTRALGCLPALRQLNMSHSKQLQSTSHNTPQLHKEVYDLKTQTEGACNQ